MKKLLTFLLTPLLCSAGVFAMYREPIRPRPINPVVENNYQATRDAIFDGLRRTVARYKELGRNDSRPMQHLLAIRMPMLKTEQAHQKFSSFGFPENELKSSIDNLKGLVNALVREDRPQSSEAFRHTTLGLSNEIECFKWHNSAFQEGHATQIIAKYRNLEKDDVSLYPVCTIPEDENLEAQMRNAEQTYQQTREEQRRNNERERPRQETKEQTNRPYENPYGIFEEESEEENPNS